LIRETMVNLLLPIESTRRELDSKLLVALTASTAAMRVYFGQRDRLHAQDIAPGIYLAKGVRRSATLSAMRGRGHRIVAMDEEGLVRFSGDAYRMRVQRGALEIPEAFLAWGRDNAEAWRALPHYRGQPIYETGNPRFDFLRPELRALLEPRARRIVAGLGRFVLFNTNFSTVNHFIPGQDRMKRPRHVARRDFERVREGIKAHKRVLFAAFRHLVPELARAIAPRPLVIRPHPSENPQVWESIAAHCDNVVVESGGGVAEWILASVAVVHNGCTSAIEANLLGKPALAYEPSKSQGFDLELPNSVSERFASAGDLIARARVLLADPPAPAPPTPLLKTHVSSLDGKLAAQRVADALTRLAGSTERRASMADRLVSAGLLRWRGVKTALSPAQRAYTSHKSDHLSLDDVKQRVAQFQPFLGDSRRVVIEPVAEYVFSLYRDAGTHRGGTEE